MKTRVLIAEDQRLLRQCFAQVLGSDPDLEVVATAANGEEAVMAALHHQPDIALMDLEMPVLDGAQATRLIRERAPAVRVLVLSQRATPAQVRKLIAEGAYGYVLKDVPPQELIRIVKGVHRGEAVSSSYLADALLREEQRRTRAQFGPRELELCALLVAGLTNAEMAERLFVSEQTVKRNMMDVLEKLGVDNRTQAAMRILELGLHRQECEREADASAPPR